MDIEGRWDIDSLYPHAGAQSIEQDVSNFIEKTTQFASLLDAVEGQDQTDPGPVMELYEALLDDRTHLRGYVRAWTLADTSDETARPIQQQVESATSRFIVQKQRFLTLIGDLDQRDHPLAGKVVQVPARFGSSSTHRMPSDLEDLAQDLAEASGGMVWQHLQQQLTTRLHGQIETEEGVEQLPISKIRTLAYDADREVRAKAFHAEQSAWASIAEPLAVALNAVKGEAIVINRRKGWESLLSESLARDGLTQDGLDSLISAVRDHLPILRRYLRAKARYLGIPQLAYYDRFAPVGPEGRGWEFTDARELILSQFDAFSPSLGEFAGKTFNNSWIDVFPREGKMDGAVCIPLRDGQSRILVNYTPSLESVSVLAHELGHAYHHWVLANRRPSERNVPLTLNETTSIFCELLVWEGQLEQSNGLGKLAILEALLQTFTEMLLDMIGRFDFENHVITERESHELTADELHGFMREAMERAYGDALDPTTQHVRMWEYAGLYYDPERSYYNYPYMVGLLLAIGIRRQGDASERHLAEILDRVLLDSGRLPFAQLLGDQGIDTEDRGFWDSALEELGHHVDAYEELVDALIVNGETAGYSTR